MRCCGDWRKAFTLIELLIVVAIMMVLMALLLIGTGAVRNLTNFNQTTQTLAAIYNGLEVFKADMGTYPRPEYRTTGVATDIYMTKGRLLSPNCLQPYVKFEGDLFKTSGGITYLTDAWGVYIRCKYTKDAKADTKTAPMISKVHPTLFIYSVGSDGLEGAGNWPAVPSSDNKATATTTNIDNVFYMIKE